MAHDHSSCSWGQRAARGPRRRQPKLPPTGLAARPHLCVMEGMCVAQAVVDGQLQRVEAIQIDACRLDQQCCMKEVACPLVQQYPAPSPHAGRHRLPSDLQPSPASCDPRFDGPHTKPGTDCSPTPHLGNKVCLPGWLELCRHLVGGQGHREGVHLTHLQQYTAVRCSTAQDGQPGGQHSNAVQSMGSYGWEGVGACLEASRQTVQPLQRGGRQPPGTHPAQLALHALICLNHCRVLLPVRHNLQQASRNAWQGAAGGDFSKQALKCRAAWEVRQAGVTGGGGPASQRSTAQHALPSTLSPAPGPHHGTSESPP